MDDKTYTEIWRELKRGTKPNTANKLVLEIFTKDFQGSKISNSTMLSLGITSIELG
jgi:hypothetical protein